MKRVTWLVIISSLILAGCESSTSVEQVSEPYNLNTQLKKVNITQTGYTTVLFENSDSLLISDYDFNAHTVEQIIFGYNLQQLFIPADTVTIMYTTSGNSQYILTFRDSVTVPDSLYNLTMVIKYMLRDNDSLIVEKNLSMLTWPYSSTALILDYKFYINTIIDDFVYKEPVLYYHPLGPDGLYSFDLNTHQTRLLFDYYAGSFINANSDYVFMDIDHRTIYRYSIAADTVTKEIDLRTVLGNSFTISGIAVNDSLIYVMTELLDKLITLNEDLEVIEVRDFQHGAFYSLTYYEGFLYTVDYSRYSNFLITRIDESSLEIIEQKMAPVEYVFNIKVYEGRLLFIDDKRPLFCSTQLDEIFQ